MPIPNIIGGLLSGGLDILGQTVTNSQNQALTNQQFQQNVEMWNLQNRYNTPFNQVQRLKAAGLNPALMYGTGSGANLSGPPPRAERPEFKLNAGQAVTNGMNTLGQYATIKNTQAQTENVESQTTNNHLDAVLKAIQKTVLETQAKKLGVDVDTSLFDLSMKKELKGYNVQQTGLDVEKTKNEIDNLMSMTSARNAETKLRQQLFGAQAESTRAGTEKTRVDTTKSQEETQNVKQQRENLRQDEIFKKFENDFKEKGINSSDHPLVRMISRLLDNQGIEIKDAQKAVSDMLKRKFKKTTGGGAGW